MKNQIINRDLILNECLETLGLMLEYDLKDFPTHQHAIRVGEGCVLIGEKMGFKPRTLQKMYYAGLLHDIGKIAIDIRLLTKREKLTDDEFDIIKIHSVTGSRILASLPELSEMALWVRWHHEWWDGSGYPDGLMGDEIPKEVQILSIIDCLDSLQTPRLDRDRLTPEEAYNIIEQDKGTFFNPEIMEPIQEMINEHTLVPGKSSTKFLELKKKYIDVPITNYGDGYWEGYGMSGIYPILKLFAKVIDAKHHYTSGHSSRVSILSKYIAEKMGLSSEDITKVEVAGLLHDAGKISVPKEILDKEGKPDVKEWEMIKNHPVFSFEILNRISSLKDIAEIAACHHERLDGNGYPKNIKGNEINILSQIIAVADTYDAITTTRTYREKKDPETAFDSIRKGLGTQFNREAGEILLNTLPKYISALFDMHRR